MKNLILIAILFCSNWSALAQESKDQLTTIILVRHAEKGTEPASDPELSLEGKERAEALSTILEKTKIDLIYSTPFERTRQTVKPLSTSKSIAIEEYNPFKMDKVMEIVKSNSGKTIVFSGHSNTTPILVNQLAGVSNYKQLNDKDYDNLYILTITEVGHGVVTELQYGKPSIF